MLEGFFPSKGEAVEDKEVCKCGKASVEFIAVGEDRWTAKLENANAKRGKGEVKYTCKSCGEVFANADSAMMTAGCI
jgi:rubrerythrin